MSIMSTCQVLLCLVELTAERSSIQLVICCSGRWGLQQQWHRLFIWKAEVAACHSLFATAGRGYMCVSELKLKSGGREGDCSS